MKAKSLSVFRTKLHHSDEATVLVTVGQVIEGDDDHLRALARNRLVELIEDGAEVNAKPAKAKAEAKPKVAAKPGAAAKPAKAKAVEPQQESTEGAAETKKVPEGGEGSE